MSRFTHQSRRGAGILLALAVLLVACGSSGPTSTAGRDGPTSPGPGRLAGSHESPPSGETTTAAPAAPATPGRAAAPGTAPSVTAGADTPGGERLPGGVSAGTGLDPARIRIPAIGVDARVTDLGYNPDGTMAVPEDSSLTGWFEHGPRPGEVGASVIVGHIDSTTGPAVFYRLSDLSEGQRITVASPDGRTVTFAVRRIEEHPKDDFPTEEVYRFTDRPTLRLVTCGGPFNDTIGHYQNNVIVFAERVA